MLKKISSICILMSMIASVSSQNLSNTIRRTQQEISEYGSKAEQSVDEYLVDSNAICKRLKSSNFVQYSTSVDKLFDISHSLVKYPDLTFEYDTKDKLLSKWIKSKLDDTSSKVGYAKFNSIVRSWTEAANKCAITVWGFNEVYLLTKNNREVYDLQKKADSPVNQNANTTRNLSLNGRIEESQRQPTVLAWSTLLDGNSTKPKAEAIPILLTILDKDQSISGQVHPEIMARLNESIAYWNNYKATSAVQTAKIIEKEKALEAKQLAQQKQQEEIYKRIKGGDLKAAQSCVDLMSALEVDDGLEAALTPHKRLKSGLATLNKYTESKLGGGVMYIIKSGYPAEVRTSSSTLWFDRDAIRVGSDVMVIGKYIDNTSIRLTNGTNRQAPVLDAVCIQPM